MSKLALLGGEPVRKKLFPFHNTIGQEEKDAVMEVMNTGVLSNFIGAWHPNFYGGEKVQTFEKLWAKSIGVDHAVAVNSNTSGLFAAIGACGIQPGDEVIVSPYTMSASAIAPIIFGGVPVFADIDPDTFCMDPASVESRITPRTKAILVVHIFGHPADMDRIMAIARPRGFKVIEDCAQAPTSTYRGRPVGSIGDIGVFSFNYHKHIHTGEGGMITTQDPDLADKARLIRNHAEAVVEAKGTTDLVNMFGFNLRMTEIEAAIGVAQLSKLKNATDKRISNAAELTQRLGKLPGLLPPKTATGARHVYYLYVLRFDRKTVGLHRNTFVKALQKELPSAVNRENTPILGAGYVKPLYLQPLYQQRAATCSFNCSRYEGEVSYAPGICPVTERMYSDEVITTEYMKDSFSKEDREDVYRAFEKVYENLRELKELEASKSL